MTSPTKEAVEAAVIVKPLEWRCVGNGLYEAQHYQVWHQWASDGRWHCSVNVARNKPELVGSGFRSPEEAKAAAQADYTSRILAALASPIPPAGAEMVPDEPTARPLSDTERAE